MTDDPWASDPFQDGSDSSDGLPSVEFGTFDTKEIQTVTADYKFELGATLKAASGFEAEWLTPRVKGNDANQTAKDAVDFLKALKEHGVIETTASAAAFTRNSYKGKGAPAPSKAAPAASGGGFEPPAQSQPASAGEVPHKRPQNTYGPEGEKTCSHGFPMEFRAFDDRNNVHRKVYNCTATDRNQQDKGIFVNPNT